MAQWYLSYGGKQQGPYNTSQAQAEARNNPDGHCWREGFTEWLPISQVGELNQAASSAMAPPSPPSSSSTADEIDFRIMIARLGSFVNLRASCRSDQPKGERSKATLIS